MKILRKKENKLVSRRDNLRNSIYLVVLLTEVDNTSNSALAATTYLDSSATPETTFIGEKPISEHVTTATRAARTTSAIIKSRKKVLVVAWNACASTNATHIDTLTIDSMLRFNVKESFKLKKNVQFEEKLRKTFKH